jgi:hypothetical protein
MAMQAIFVELPAFERCRQDYLDDDDFRRLQTVLLANPQAGDVIQGTGGIRKLRCGDPRRGKGKRGGLRVIYYYWVRGPEFWLFTVYDKRELSDLTPGQRAWLKGRIKDELKMRSER